MFWIPVAGALLMFDPLLVMEIQQRDRARALMCFFSHGNAAVGHSMFLIYE